MSGRIEPLPERLSRSRQAEACFLPSLDAAGQNLHIRKSFVPIFRCPTSSARFFRSGSVKDDFLLLG